MQGTISKAIEGIIGERDIAKITFGFQPFLIS